MRGSFRRVDKDWYFVPDYLLSQFAEELVKAYHISALDTFLETFSKYRIDKLVFDLPIRSVL